MYELVWDGRQLKVVYEQESYQVNLHRPARFLPGSEEVRFLSFLEVRGSWASRAVPLTNHSVKAGHFVMDENGLYIIEKDRNDPWQYWLTPVSFVDATQPAT